jgi:hypothetical protein
MLLRIDGASEVFATTAVDEQFYYVIREFGAKVLPMVIPAAALQLMKTQRPIHDVLGRRKNLARSQAVEI